MIGTEEQELEPTERCWRCGATLWQHEELDAEACSDFQRMEGVQLIPAPPLRPGQPYLRYVDIIKPVFTNGVARIEYLTAEEIEAMYGRRM